MNYIYLGIEGSCKKGLESGAGEESIGPRQKQYYSGSDSQSEAFDDVKEIVNNYATIQRSKIVAASGKSEQSSNVHLQDHVYRTMSNVNKICELI